MKEIPILFSTPMVQAILAGRKTFTRRVLKFPNDYDGKAVFNNHPYGVKYSSNEFDGCVKRLNSKWCPGDLLWVRESWQMTGWDFKDGIMTIHYKDGQWLDCMAPEEDGDLWLLNYVERLEKIGCLKQDPNDEERFVFTDKPQPWKPSIHMPKTASRIWLEVTNVRVERLQDISEDDAKAEGAEKVWQDANGVFWYPSSETIRQVGEFGDYQTGFKSIWVTINGQESWQANPWVWVVEFKLLSTTGKP